MPNDELEQLPDMDRLYRSVVVNARDSVLITEAEPISGGGPRIVYVNPAFSAMTGYAPLDIIGRTPRILQGRNSSREALDRIRAALESWQPVRQELTNYRKDGSEFTVEIDIVPVADASGWFTHWVSIQRDTTERRVVERELQETQLARRLAEQLSRAKSEFLANMSHELRTPLNGILGYAEALQMQMLGPLNAKQQDYIGVIRRSGLHLLEIVSHILDLSKIEAGHFELAEEAFDLASVVAECIRFVTPQADDAKLTVVAEQLRPEIRVLADRLRLKQLLLNLLSNAIKFTPAGGIVRVQVGFDAEGRLGIAVSDEGIGMTAEEIDVALQPFGQVANGWFRQGTGLGLPLARHLVELHGGLLLIDSIVGKGTRVVVSLPSYRIL